MNSTISPELALRQQNHEAARERALLFRTFFCVDRTELQDDGSLKLQFNAQAADGSSEEKMYVYLLPTNTPEKNMELLLAARQRQYWYSQKRAETPGIPVPPPVQTGS